MTFRRTAFALLLLSAGAPALAADPAPVATRVDRLEKEMRAVQRKVFPGGSPAFFEPEIAAAAPAAAPVAVGAPPLAELTSRVDGLERELARLTAQIEQDEHRLTILSEQTAKDRGAFEARLKALETPVAVPASAPATDIEEAPPPRPKPAKAKPAKAPPTPAAETDPAATMADPAPAASGDPAEAGYMAGYKLWTDKKYAEAETQLTKVAKQYPKSRRASYARNLAGRAQLDGGKPATAAQTFLANYQADPHGERAPESLFYLGQALTQLKKTDNACRAYGELEEVYGATMSDALKAKLGPARKAAACK